MPLELLPKRSNLVSSENIAQYGFESDEVNVIFRQEYADFFSKYQEMFRLYSYATLTRDRRFKVHRPKGNPLLWQPMNSCSYKETRTVSVTDDVIEADRTYMLEKHCFDELFNSDFRHFVNYVQGRIQRGVDYEALISKIIDEVIINAHINARNLIASGGLYNIDDVIRADLAPKIEDALRRTYNTTKGWVGIAKEHSASKPWMHVSNLYDSTKFDANGEYHGSVLDIVDKLKKNARPPLKRLIAHGGTITSQGALRAVIVVDSNTFNTLSNEFAAQGQALAQNQPRIRERSLPGNMLGEVMYFVDNLPVIPLEDITGFDTYFKGQTYFAGIMATSNLNFGFSFGEVSRNVENKELSVILEYDDTISNGNYGQTSMQAMALIKAIIADAEYYVGGSTFKEFENL